MSGDNTDRVFEIASDATVTISGLTVRDGYIAEHGGGIWSEGELHLITVHIISNTTARSVLSNAANLSPTLPTLSGISATHPVSNSLFFMLAYNINKGIA